MTREFDHFLVRKAVQACSLIGSPAEVTAGSDSGIARLRMSEVEAVDNRRPTPTIWRQKMKMSTFASAIALTTALSVGSIGAFAQTPQSSNGHDSQAVLTLAAGDGSGADVRANRGQFAAIYDDPNTGRFGGGHGSQTAAGDGSGADVRANRHQYAAGDGSSADVRANRTRLADNGSGIDGRPAGNAA